MQEKLGFMGSKQRAYDAEFREGAVHIVIETGKPIPEVADELGVNPGTLHRWVSRWRRHGSATSDRPAEAAAGGRLREAGRAELEGDHQAALGYSNLHREMELADQLVKRVKVHDTGLFAMTPTSKTDQSGKGADRFIPDRTIATSVTMPGRAAEASALGPLALAGLGDGEAPGR